MCPVFPAQFPKLESRLDLGNGEHVGRFLDIICSDNTNLYVLQYIPSLLNCGFKYTGRQRKGDY